jgi:hypothetical protein
VVRMIVRGDASQSQTASDRGEHSGHVQGLATDICGPGREELANAPDATSSIQERALAAARRITCQVSCLSVRG